MSFSVNGPWKAFSIYSHGLKQIEALEMLNFSACLAVWQPIIPKI